MSYVMNQYHIDDIIDLQAYITSPPASRNQTQLAQASGRRE